jgi:REase_AHJR-like protein
MTLQQVEASVIAKIAGDYRQRGYEVDVQPTGANLPDFLRGFRPDLIARSPGDNVVVEVKIGTRTAVADRLRDVTERVSQEPGWRFSLVFANPDQPDDLTDAAPAPLATVEQRVQDAERLLAAGEQEAAFLLLWSSAEGILRLLGERAFLPLTSLPPSALIRELYSAGEISGEQFETLMRLLPRRNQLVHGFGSKEGLEAEQLALLVNALLGEVRNPERVD